MRSSKGWFAFIKWATGGLWNCSFSLQQPLHDSVIFLASFTEYDRLLARMKCITWVTPRWHNALWNQESFQTNSKLNKNIEYHVINSLLQHCPLQVDTECQNCNSSTPTHEFVIFYFSFLWLIRHEWNFFLVSYECKVSTS